MCRKHSVDGSLHCQHRQDQGTMTVWPRPLNGPEPPFLPASVPPPAAARIRAQVQRFHFHAACVLFIFMETLKLTFQAPLTRPSIHQYPSPISRHVLGSRLVPDTTPSPENEDTAASCPPGAGLQVGRHFFIPLPSQYLSAGDRGGRWLLLCSHFKRRGLPQNHTGSSESTLLGSPVGMLGTSRLLRNNSPKS